MVSKKLSVINEQGFHMRPANVFASEVGKFKSDVTIKFGGREINGKSIMNIMAACIKYGAEIEIVCSGEDEKECLDKAVALVESGLGE